MTTTEVTITVIICIVVGFVIWLILDRLQKKLDKKQLEELIEKARTGKLKTSPKDPKNGVILTADTEVRLARKEKTLACVQWTCVQEVSAFKRDLFTVDLVCIALKFRQNDQELYLELNEDMVGWEDFVKTLETHFIFRAPDWRQRVTYPAFKTNLTVLWQIGDPTNAPSIAVESH